MNESIDRINELWTLHEPSDTAPGDTPPCQAFAVDPRHVERDGVRYRWGVSFGGNPFTPEDNVGFVPPPVRPGRYVLGLHEVATEGDRLSLIDQWFDAREVGSDVVDAESGLEAARGWLREIPDERYAELLAERRDEAVTLGLERERPVERLEVIGFDTGTSISDILALL